MKSFRFLLGFALIGLLITLSGCPGNKDPELTVPQQQNKKLAKAWVCTAATLDGSAASLPAPSTYTYVGNFKLTMVGATGTDATAGPTYTTAGRPTGSKVTPWNSTGSFTFGTDAATTLIREDGIIVSYSVSDTQLQMSFNTGGKTPPFAGYDGRVGNVQGNWVFTFGL
ncbi:hypothetical protein BH09BAC3_BH09BAC3_09390 [soil metagenome]